MAFPVQPQPGGTYIMKISDGRTIIFTFVNVGHYIVDGQDVKTGNFSDLATPFTIDAGPFNYNGPL